MAVAVRIPTWPSTIALKQAETLQKLEKILTKKEAAKTTNRNMLRDALVTLDD